MPRWHFPWKDGGRYKWLKNDKSENNDVEIEAKCLYDTSPDEMVDDVSDLKIYNNENNYEKIKMNA